MMNVNQSLMATMVVVISLLSNIASAQASVCVERAERACADAESQDSCLPRERYACELDRAPRVCAAPCRTNGHAAVTPATTEEFQQAVQFLASGFRMCEVNCTCTVPGRGVPSYCSASTPAAAPAEVAPARTEPAPPAPAARPTPDAPAVPDAMFPPYLRPGAPGAAALFPPYLLPQGVGGAGGVAPMTQMNFCSRTGETLATLVALNQAVMPSMMAASGGMQFASYFDATWNMTMASPARGTGSDISFHVLPSDYAMVVSLRYIVQTPNGPVDYVREIVPFRNGVPVLAAAERRSGGRAIGGHCLRGHIPAQTDSYYSFRWEGQASNFQIEATCYNVTPAGTLGAPVEYGTTRNDYHIATARQVSRNGSLRLSCGMN